MDTNEQRLGHKAILSRILGCVQDPIGCLKSQCGGTKEFNVSLGADEKRQGFRQLVW